MVYRYTGKGESLQSSQIWEGLHFPQLFLAGSPSASASRGDKSIEYAGVQPSAWMKLPTLLYVLYSLRGFSFKRQNSTENEN